MELFKIDIKMTGETYEENNNLIRIAEITKKDYNVLENLYYKYEEELDEYKEKPMFCKWKPEVLNTYFWYGVFDTENKEDILFSKEDCEIIKNIIHKSTLLEFSKHPEWYQPSGRIRYDLLLKNPIITFYKTVYKRHTNFTMENLQKKNMCDFGKECIFGKGYWQQNKFIWIHEGKNGVYYNGEYVPFYPIKIVLPPIYYNNQTSEQCYII